MKLSRLREVLDNQAPSFCIYRGPGIGDVIMTTPTVRAIKETFPKSHITYATNLSYLGGAIPKVLKYNPFIDKIVSDALVNPSDYDMYLDLQCPCVTYEKKENPPINRIDLFANYVGIQLEDKKPVYVSTPDELELGKQKVKISAGRKKIFIQPFASCSRRSYPHGKLKKIAQELGRLGAHLFISTHTGDWQSDTLWDNLPYSQEVKDWDIRQLAGLIANCDLVLCQDSSILHLAGALDVPTVSLFGPTHPEARVNHYPNAVAIWGAEGLVQCPCWWDHCSIGMACWENIKVNTVVDVCVKHLMGKGK